MWYSETTILKVFHILAKGSLAIVLENFRNRNTFAKHSFYDFKEEHKIYSFIEEES